MTDLPRRGLAPYRGGMAEPADDQGAARRNQIGQVMGRKGAETRARLVAAARRLVSSKPLRALRVAEIAREAGVGAPSFYVYFQDVGEAVLAALEDHPQSAPGVLAVLELDWSDDTLGCARAFVDAYLDVWIENFALLRARNLAADEGDERFTRQRLTDIGPVLVRLAAKFQAAQAAGRAAPDVSANAAAGVMVAALERLAAAPRQRRQGEGYADADLRAAAAHMLASALGAPG